VPRPGARPSRPRPPGRASRRSARGWPPAGRPAPARRRGRRRARRRCPGAGRRCRPWPRRCSRRSVRGASPRPAPRSSVPLCPPRGRSYAASGPPCGACRGRRWTPWGRVRPFLPCRLPG